jgi:hypothetical protein
MTDEAQESQATDGQQIPASVLPEAQESEKNAATDNQALTQDNKPAGYHPVDLNGVPEEYRKPIEERFGYFMSQIRENKRTLNEYRGVAQSQAEKIEELMSGVGQVVDHLQTKSLDEAEALVKQQMRTAHEAGDTDSFITANERLAEIKAKKIAQQQRPKAETQPKPKAKGYHSASEMADDAIADGEINTEEGRAIAAWQGERDAAGNSLRPWAKTRNPENPTADPLYRRALIEAAAVFDEASPWASKTTSDRLAEVDRRMGLTRNTGTQTVMGGQLTNARKPQKLTLSSDAQKLALKIGKGKNDTEKLDWYRKQLEKTNSKGARK